MRLDEHFLVSPTIIEAISGSSEALSVSKAPSKAELPDGVLCRVSYPICAIGERNANNRVYEKAVWDKVLTEGDLKRKLENRALFGHAEHPEQTQSNLEKTCHVIFEMWQDNGVVWQTLDIFDTPCGRIVDCLLRAGCKVGMSTRAEGDLEEAEDDNGAYHNVVAESYSYETTDFTADPSTSSALPYNVKFKVVKEIIKASEMKEATISEKEFASRVLESIKCKDKSKCQNCGACGMNKNTVESLVEAKTIVVESELTYGDKSATVAEINETSITLNVTDEAGDSMQINVDGASGVHVDSSGAVMIDPANASNLVDAPVKELPCPDEEVIDPANTGLGMSAIDTELPFECKGCGTIYGKAEQLDENGKCEICRSVLPEAKVSVRKKGKPKVGDKIIMLEDGEHKDKEGTITSIDETSIGISLDGGVDVQVEDPSMISITTNPPPAEPTDESPCPDEGAPEPMEDLIPDEDMDEKIPAEAGISDKLASGNLLQDKNGVAWIVKSADDGALIVTQPGEPGSEKRIPWDEADSYGFVKLSESKGNEGRPVVSHLIKYYKELKSGHQNVDDYEGLDVEKEMAAVVKTLEWLGYDINKLDETKVNEKIPSNIAIEALKILQKNSGISYKEIVNSLLDNPGHRKWFEEDYHGNEFDLRQELEDVLTDEIEDESEPKFPGSGAAKESASKNIVKDLRVKEAATRAERDKAIELLEELEGKEKVKEGKVFEVKILVRKINETLQAKELEEKGIRSALEAKAKLVSNLAKQVDEHKESIAKVKTEMNESVLNSQTVKSELRASISVTEQKHAKALKVLKEKHEQALTEAEKKYHEKVSKVVSEAEETAKNSITKEFVTSFVEYKLSETNSKIDDNSRALLEDCKSLEEVEELLEDVMDARRRSALHSDPIRGIKVVKHEVVNEEHKEAERSVNEAFEGMGY